MLKGITFYTILIILKYSGALCLTVGAVIAIVDLMYPHKFSTILEVDYGTPFDRHIIIEESHYTRRKKGSGKRSLEDPEPMGFGRKILRYNSVQVQLKEMGTYLSYKECQLWNVCFVAGRFPREKKRTT
jgi:hypothetical protein